VGDQPNIAHLHRASLEGRNGKQRNREKKTQECYVVKTEKTQESKQRNI
jgi:hypothetical protein